jgi:hypothetical protein
MCGISKREAKGRMVDPHEALIYVNEKVGKRRRLSAGAGCVGAASLLKAIGRTALQSSGGRPCFVML